MLGSIENPQDNTSIIAGNDRNLGFVKKAGFNAHITTNNSSDFTFSKLNQTTLTPANIAAGTLTTLATISNGGNFSVIGNITGSNALFSGDMVVRGNLTAQQLIISSSVTYLTQSFASGSHKFGDSLDDTHQFTGSVNISGSQSLNGNLTVTIGGSTELQVLSDGVTIGNAVADNHNVSGALRISGSLVINGTSYTAATSGTSGTGGSSGSGGTSGVNGGTGPSGTSGSGGTSGSSGTMGTAGSGGTSGVNGGTGPTGPSGTSGSGGTSGVNGGTGPTGPSGTSGSGGTSGSSGSSGSSGTMGTAGSGGTSGVNGGTGPIGPSGTSGSGGTSGVNGGTGPTGPSGTSGSGGTSGSSGSSGTRGSSGTSGVNGGAGPTGPTGPTGPSGTSNVYASAMNQYVNTNNGPTFDTVYTNNWFRSYGATGWYNESYGGGIFMQDTTWVRVYASKAFYVANQIAATSDITAYYSDERLKENLGPIENPLDKVNKLNGFYYVNNDLAKTFGYNDAKLQIGVSAQEVQAILPEVVSLAPFDFETLEDGETVSKSGENYLTVKYDKIVPLLIEAIKELTEEVNKIKKHLSLE